jgi:hypothetical protein
LAPTISTSVLSWFSWRKLWAIQVYKSLLQFNNLSVELNYSGTLSRSPHTLKMLSSPNWNLHARTLGCTHTHLCQSTVVYCIKLCLCSGSHRFPHKPAYCLREASIDGSSNPNSLFTFMICWTAYLLCPTQCQTVSKGTNVDENGLEWQARKWESASSWSLKRKSEWGREGVGPFSGMQAKLVRGAEGEAVLSGLADQSELSEPSPSISSGIVHRPAALKYEC